MANKTDKERMGSDMKYVIDSKIYEKHIQDEVHLYGLLHQLAFLAGKVKNDEDMEDLIDMARRYGEIAEEKFDGWHIPGRYLVFGDKKDLAELKGKELSPLSEVLAEHDAKKMSEALAQASWDMPYIIHGGSVRLLVGSIFELLAHYGSLTRKIQAVKTEKDLTRLQKQVSRNGNAIRRMCRSWGVPKEQDITCHEVLERAVRNKHLIPVQEDELVLVCELDCSDAPDEGEDILTEDDFFEDEYE